MDKVSRIMLATDFSESSQAATDYALTLAKQLGVQIEVIHVFDEHIVKIPAPYYFLPDSSESIGKYVEENKKRGKKLLNELCLTLGAGTIPHLLEGNPSRQITEFVNQNQVDLLIVGTRASKGLERIMLSSVAEYIVRFANCPVLVIKTQDNNS